MGRLVRFDALNLTLLDRERRELRVVDVAARRPLADVTDLRLPMEGTLADWVVAHRTPRRVDDVITSYSIHYTKLYE